MLGAGVAGALTGYYLQYFIAAIVYPLNIGGRPLNSWPVFIPIIFELTVLFAACAAFFGVLFFAGFPAPYHPLFRIPTFKRASRRWLLPLHRSSRPATTIDVDTARFLQSLEPVGVWEVDDE